MQAVDGSVAATEATVPRRGGETGELRVTHMDQGRVVSALEKDLRLLLDAVVDNEVQPVTLSDGGNGASRAVLKQIFDLTLCRQVDVIAELPFELRESNLVRSWQHCERVANVIAQQDCLGETIARNATGLGDLQRRVGRGMHNHVMLDVMGIQISFQCQGNSHVLASSANASLAR